MEARSRPLAPLSILAVSRWRAWRFTRRVSIPSSPTTRSSPCATPSACSRVSDSPGPPVEGYVEGEAQRRGVSKEDVIAEITSQFCIPEIPADEDVAEAVVFLASDRARMITGQYLLVNSGELMT